MLVTTSKQGVSTETVVVQKKMTDQDYFDETARDIVEKRLRLTSLQDEAASLEKHLRITEQELASMIDAGVKGKEMTAEWVVSMRRIGRPKPEDLAALEQIDERLVKRIPGSVTVRVVDQTKLMAAAEILEKAGIQMVETPPCLGPPKVGDVDDVIKDRSDLWGKQREIWDRVDLQETKKLKVFPTILGTAEEQ
jgi:hypothetical protein